MEGAFLFRRNMWGRNNQASLERNQRRIEAGIMAKNYPEVESIVISMKYKQRGVANPLLRTLNFYPGSYAFFQVNCLSDECVDGGFDMSWIITSMIRNHSDFSKGELGCNDNGPRPDHSHIVYEIHITYS
jgi:hypothetical protein